MSKDLDYVAKVEKEIAKKYGKEAIANPRNSWNAKKEEKFLKSSKKLQQGKDSHQDKVLSNGFEVSKRFLNRPKSISCPVCGKYNLTLEDEVKMLVHKCCFKCYVQYVEGREERWKSGWRPNNQNFPKK
jgi:hypothetical protein